MRYLYFDRVLEVEPGRRALAVKSVALSEEFLPGHFGRRAVMPPTLVLEALAQLGGWLHIVTRDFKAKILLALIQAATFRRVITPGDRLMLEIWMDFDHREGATMHAEARIDHEVVVSVDRIVFASEFSDDEDLIQVRREDFVYASGGFTLPSEES